MDHGLHEPSVEELERELPAVMDGQISLGDLLSRVMQAIYAELAELAETMPNMSDSARKRTLADWVVKTKKQVVKLYAVTKWTRDAETVQKCMNITAFLMTQNHQFEGAMEGLKYARESLDPARLRNHDLLTSLDVLTTGSYLRLPTCITKSMIPVTPLTDSQVTQTLRDMEDVIRYRLRVSEVVPVEMSQYRIADGRVYFTVPKLFEVSLCLRGAQQDDGWFFVHVMFLINIRGGLTGLQGESHFPRTPTGIMKRHITDEADARLAFYLPLPEEAQNDIPTRPQLPSGVVDTPLVRVYNFLQIMSLSYQLEILWYQAQRMRSLGWADYLTIEMSQNRKVMTVSYWIRQPPPSGRQNRIKLPLLGGTITISIVESHGPSYAGRGPARSPKRRVFARLQRRAKLGVGMPSDEVEGLKFQVLWEPAKGALGVNVLPSIMFDDLLHVDADNLDFESLLCGVIERHAHSILETYQYQLQNGQARTVFSLPGAVTLIKDEGVQALRIHLCADEVVIMTIDSRTGRLNLRDTGDLAAAGRGPHFTGFSEQLNENPQHLITALIRLRLMTITDLAEQKAKYLGLESFRRRNFPPQELHKLGPATRGTLYIQLSNFPNHYLVLVITDERFQYALITTRIITESMYADMIMEDIAWLDFDRIHSEEIVITARSDMCIGKRKRDSDTDIPNESEMRKVDSGFNIETAVLRELYSYCCARVAFMNVERQFKLRGIPFTHVNPTSGSPVTLQLAHIQSSLARSVPALCVQSQDILSGAPAAEAAMPNIRVIPLNWWSEKNAQVVTSVKLKYVQQPMGKTAGTSAVIRPSKRIIYDTTQAVVSFLSENVNTCVDEFLEEWARVSKMVVIAREVAQMAKEGSWDDVRLLSFDLRTVEFAYAKDYTVSISCQDQLSPMGGNFNLRFSRCGRLHARHGQDKDHHHQEFFNPHDDAEPFLRNILRHGHGRLAPSLHRLVTILRDTLPIVVVLEDIRQESMHNNRGVDTFAKAAGWYRLLNIDQRHALDFRLMTGQRVAILDGSFSLFDPTGSRGPAEGGAGEMLGLKPISHFKDIVTNAVRDVVASGSVQPGKVAIIDVGVICHTVDVCQLGKSIHQRLVSHVAH
ncbi:Mediator of RNA polymerase II transcription subunit 14 [Termitomyces sp. J132]|nr:Mediator of RNA polymerase II transcription subunit 14 [Termitomyces sp. J132]